MTVRSLRRFGLGLSLALVVAAATSVAGQGGGRGGGAAGQGPLGGRGVAPPTRDVGGQLAVGTGAMAGIVVLDGAGTPVRRARVSLAAPELRGGRSALTDDQGRFTFPLLPAGRYSLSVSKAGFVDIAYGARRPGRPGTPIQLAEGQEIKDLRVALPRGGVITGIVVDEHGEPAAGTPVRALRYVMQTGERRLQQAGQDQTDDRGMYRIYQLQPGDYIVSAAPRNVAVGAPTQALLAEVQALRQTAGGGNVSVALTENVLSQIMPVTEGQQPSAYAPVYYPGTTSAESALTVTLNAGEERAGVDFRLQLVPTTRVSGLVVNQTGDLPPGVMLTLLPRNTTGALMLVPGSGLTGTRVGSDGRFSFNSVTPGDYVLQARAAVRAAGAAPAPGRGGRGGQGPVTEMLWAAADISVTGQPLPEIVLTLQPGMTVSGRVQFESATPPTELSGVRVTLAPRGAQGFEGTLQPGQTDAEGRFSILGVAPGRYSLTAALLGGGRGGRGGAGAILPGPDTASQWQLKSAMYNGHDLLDFPVEIGPNQSLQNVVVTYTDRTQELTGTLQDTTGRPTAEFTIIVFPSDEQFWQPQSRRISATRPGTDGRFTFRGLPPGDYRLTAVTDIEPGEWYDPAFLQQLNNASIPIALGEGERKVQDIRLAGN